MLSFYYFFSRFPKLEKNIKTFSDPEKLRKFKTKL